MREYMYWKWGYMKSRKKKDENASRKKARYKMEKKWKVRKFDWKEVDHKNSNPNDNSDNNLSVISRKRNRRKWARKANRRMGRKV